MTKGIICPRCGHQGIRDGIDYRPESPRQKYACILKGGCRYRWSQGLIERMMEKKARESAE
jgi:hypothetical protein